MRGGEVAVRLGGQQMKFQLRRKSGLKLVALLSVHDMEPSPNSDSSKQGQPGSQKTTCCRARATG